MSNLEVKANLRGKTENPSKTKQLTLKEKQNKISRTSKSYHRGAKTHCQSRKIISLERKLENKRSKVHRSLRQVCFQRFVSC